MKFKIVRKDAGEEAKRSIFEKSDLTSVGFVIDPETGKVGELVHVEHEGIDWHDRDDLTFIIN